MKYKNKFILDYDIDDIIKFMKEEKGKVREIHITLITQNNMCHNPCLQNKEYSNMQLKQNQKMDLNKTFSAENFVTQTHGVVDNHDITRAPVSMDFVNCIKVQGNAWNTLTMLTL